MESEIMSKDGIKIFNFSNETKEILDNIHNWSVEKIFDTNLSLIDKLYIVLREDFIDKHTLYDFGCRCVETVMDNLGIVDNESVQVITANRLWNHRKISEAEFNTAAHNAWVVLRNFYLDAKLRNISESDLNLIRSLAYQTLNCDPHKASFGVIQEIYNTINQQSDISNILKLYQAIIDVSCEFLEAMRAA